MKKILGLLVAALMLSFLFNSCTKEDTFDETLLIGKWVMGTDYLRYDANHHGEEWDTSDDVHEGEGQAFDWSLDKADLTLIHYVGDDPQTPKPYTVTELTSTTLKYKDNSSTYSFTKVN